MTSKKKKSQNQTDKKNLSENTVQNRKPVGIKKLMLPNSVYIGLDAIKMVY